MDESINAKFIEKLLAIRFLIKGFVDFLFPPFCLSCRERCSTRYLCEVCWAACELPDPVLRCRHCFEELDRRGNLCAQCRTEKLLDPIRGYVFDSHSPARMLGTEAVHAMASFAYIQWIQLEWLLPDAIIPMPDSIEIGRAFAELMNVPFVRALNSNSTYKEDRLEEDQVLLVFDVSNSIETLQKATSALREAFPKRVYLLSLLPC